MAMFGRDWLEDHDPERDYEFSVSGMSHDEDVPYDRPICPPVHVEDYDPLEEYEAGIKHFN